MALAVAGIVSRAAAQRIDSSRVDTVAPGVVHRSLFAGEGPWSIHVLEVDLRRRDLRVEAARARNTLRGRETVSDIVRDHATDTTHVVAAVNADFFDLRTGEDENNQVIDGEIWKAEPRVGAVETRHGPIHSQFAMSWAGRPIIAPIVFTAAGYRRRSFVLFVDAINHRSRLVDEVLYTSRYGRLTPSDTSGLLVEVRLRSLPPHGDTLRYRAMSLPVEAGTTLLTDGLALSALRTAIDHGLPNPGDTIDVVPRFAPLAAVPRTLTGGWPRLVVDGQSIADSVDRLEGTTPSFSVTRHPRTGIGFSRDSTTLYLITVDGRQESSSGMSLAEFARLMIQLGVYQGLNLDGGGSTAMVVNGRLANHPSDPGGERAVGNALLIVRHP